MYWIRTQYKCVHYEHILPVPSVAIRYSGVLVCAKHTQQSTLGKKIRLSMHPRNFGSDKIFCYKDDNFPKEKLKLFNSLFHSVYLVCQKVCSYCRFVCGALSVGGM